MADPKDRLTTVQASVERPARFSRMDMMAAGLSLVWLVAVAVYAMMAPGGAGGPLGVLMTLLMVFLPIALIWITVTTLRSVQDLRAEAARAERATRSLEARIRELGGQTPVVAEAAVEAPAARLPAGVAAMAGWASNSACATSASPRASISRMASGAADSTASSLSGL